MWGVVSGQRAGGGVVQNDGDHRRLQGRGALDGQVDRCRGFGFNIVAKAAQRPVCLQRRADGGDQVIMDIAGHVSPKMLKLYSHIRLEAKCSAVEALGRLGKPVEVEPMGQPEGAESLLI